MANQLKIAQYIIEINLVWKLNSLMANLTISNDLADRIRVVQDTIEQLQGFLTSLKQVKKWEDGVIGFDSQLCA